MNSDNLITVPTKGIWYVEPMIEPLVTSHLKELGIDVFRVRPGGEKLAEKKAFDHLVVASGFGFARRAQSLVTVGIFDLDRVAVYPDPLPLMVKAYTKFGEKALKFAVDCIEVRSIGNLKGVIYSLAQGELGEAESLALHECYFVDRK